MHPTEPRLATSMLDGCALLVVDDDVDALELYARALRRLGATVKTASSAEMAREILDGWQPDVMLCDLHLPGIDGYDLIRAIRGDARLERLPVIAISAGHPTIERDRSLRAGFAAHLAKPSKLSEIVALVASIAAARAGLPE